MKRIKLLFAIIMMVFLLVGCGNSENKVVEQTKEVVEESREVINVPYVESMLDKDVEPSEIDKVIKENKGKFVRWTAYAIEIKEKEIVIQLEGFTRVEAVFENNINDDEQIKEGDIITISGNLKKYYPGLGSIPPIWVLENCRIEKTTEDEKKFVIDFNKETETETNKIISSDYQSFQEEYRGLTELQKNDYFNNVYGRWVQWKGIVREVTREYVYIKCLDSNLNYDYVAYFSPEHTEELKSINKGSEITIKGRIYTVVRGVQWTLTECTAVK